jgi:CBS-domain-containing membrane protein
MLPVEGERAGEKRAGHFAQNDAVTCALSDDALAVHERIDVSPHGFALVLAADGTILGRLRHSAIDEAGSGTAEELMNPGPSTVRPDTDVGELRQKLDAKGLKTAIVSTPEGKLIGVIARAALEE